MTYRRPATGTRCRIGSIISSARPRKRASGSDAGNAGQTPTPHEPHSKARMTGNRREVQGCGIPWAATRNGVNPRFLSTQIRFPKPGAAGSNPAEGASRGRGPASVALCTTVWWLDHSPLWGSQSAAGRLVGGIDSHSETRSLPASDRRLGQVRILFLTESLGEALERAAGDVVDLQQRLEVRRLQFE